MTSEPRGNAIYSRTKSVLGTALACAAMIAFGATGIHHPLGLATTIPIYLLCALVVAWRLGFAAAVIASLCATVCLDFFCTEPMYALRVTSMQDITALSSFACVSLLASHLSNKVQRTGRALKQQEQQQRLLYQLSCDAHLLDWRAPIGLPLCMLVEQAFHLSGVGIWNASTETFSFSGNAGDTRETLRAAFMARSNFDLDHRPDSVRILHFAARPIGAIVLCGHQLDPLAVSAIANLVASTLERARALKAEVLAESDKFSEQLRSAVLDGLAHAAKTPLTTIAISSAGLIEIGGLTPIQRELVDLIDGQTSRLSALTDKLLRTNRLELHELKLHRAPINLTELLNTTSSEIGPELDPTRLRTNLTHQSQRIQADPELLSMAFLQVLENALKYSPSSTEVLVSTAFTPETVTVSIHNQGSYIPAEERELIFRRFYRSRAVEHRASGTGVGLSASLRAVEAHGGRIWAESDPATGTTFHIALPLTGDTP
nr:ATP-binding protein [Granulicella sp. dw_53]